MEEGFANRIIIKSNKKNKIETQKGAVLELDKGIGQEKKATETREGYRENIEKYLPLDLQLKFKQKGDWNFDNELLKRRHSEDKDDQYFFALLKNKKRELSVEEKEKLSLLESEAEAEKDSVKDRLSLYLMPKKCLARDWNASAGKIAIELGDIESAKEALQKFLRFSHLYEAGNIAAGLAEKDPETAKQVIQICLEREPRGGYATNIVIALVEKDPEYVKQIMNNFLETKDFNGAGKIAIALAEKDPESVRRVMIEFFNEGWNRQAGEIAVALGDIESAKQAIQKDLDKNWSGNPPNWELIKIVTTAIVEKDPEFARQAMQKCFDYGHPDEAGGIAVFLAKKYPESVRQIMQAYLNNSEAHPTYYIEAGKIALALGDIESAKQAMKKIFHKGSPGYASEIAVAIAEKDPEAAKQAMRKCLDEGQTGFATEIAIALAKKDPESVRQVMKNFFDEEVDDNNRGSAVRIAIALDDMESAKQGIKEMIYHGNIGYAGKMAMVLDDAELLRQAIQKSFDKDSSWDIDRIIEELFNKFPLFDKAEKIKNSIFELCPERVYSVMVAMNILDSGESLSRFQLDYLPNLLAIQEYANKVNSEIVSEKKWEDPKDFFRKHGADLAELQAINLDLSSQLMKSLVSRGLSFTEANLNIYHKALDNKDTNYSIKNFVSKNPDMKPFDLGQLLETASAYVNADLSTIFKKTLEKSLKYKEAQEALNKELINIIVNELGISAEVKPSDLSDWHLRYLPNLVSNSEMIKEGGDENDIALYNSLLKSVFEGRFKEFITNSDQDDEIGKNIAEHNQEVQKSFEKEGINWEGWENFSGQIEFEIGTKKKNDQEALFVQFQDRLDDFKKSLETTPLLGSIKKDIAELQKNKKTFDPTTIDINDKNWSDSLFPNYIKGLNFILKKDPSFSLPTDVLENLNHLAETIKSFSNSIKEQTSQKKFIVRKWDRDPRRDLFQGNFTHCCIAVGVKETPPGGGLTTFHPETILEYLVDKGIQVAEIIDPDTNEPIGQCWLFVTLGIANKPVLVADNFEVNNRYPAGNNINRGIRQAMTDFLNEYAKAAGISRVVLGKVGTNDIETEGMKIIKMPLIKKLGGYLNDEEYYLESLDDELAFEFK